LTIENPKLITINQQSSINNHQSRGQQSSINNHQSMVRRKAMLRVLLVEDNGAYRKAFKENLSEHFPTLLIDEAENGDEALQKINEAPPHLIFMDIRLPGVNGLQLTRRIKRDFPNIRIAMLTGYDVPEYRQAALQYGADGFFSKEFLKWDEIETLVESIEQIS
jgi:YesN/AraC family two-component response regulator